MGLGILEYTKHGKNNIIPLIFASVIYVCIYTGVQYKIFVFDKGTKKSCGNH